jgi:aspartyl-tRNA(Asn)/glutamyl-tRNA(Gln) amidotransferase subunit A
MTSGIPATAVATAKAVRTGDLSATEVVKAALEVITAKDNEIGAFTTVAGERALAEAEAVDKARRAGGRLGPLAGVPFGVKDLFDIRGVATLAGSKINRSRPPAQADAVLIERMNSAGAILLGGLKMGEFAYDFTGENAHYGPSRNPLDTTRMSGGSSGGSAAAVAAGFVPISLGSDTNGSIRVPSAFCGLYGLKPTYGRLPRTRTFPFCDSLDHLGPFARTVADLALCYDALQGWDEGDAACVNRPAELASPELSKGIGGLRIAIAGGYFSHQAEPGALAAVERVARALNATEVFDIPDVGRARASAFLITNAEGSALHLDNLRSRADDFDPDTRDRFLAGAVLPASWYVAAQRFRQQFEETMSRVFSDFDIILAPSTPFSAPRLGQKTMMLGDREVPLRPNIGIFTQPSSFIGLPVAAVPVRVMGQMPYGVQIISRPWREDLCLRAAAIVEAAGLAPSPH